MALTGTRRIEELAALAGFDPRCNSKYFNIYAFASLVQADERAQCISACAKEKSSFERNTYGAYDGRYDWKADGAEACIEAILLRGKSDKQD
jgi:hypothetical protein